jgi:C4-dicarboxylate-specific signal transduction histidine kinase
LFWKSNQKREQVDVNEIVLGVLQASRKELQDHGVEIRLELASEPPLVGGHRGQLEEVIFNLVHNAIEAMDRWVGLGVIADNVVNIGRAIQKQAT